MVQHFAARLSIYFGAIFANLGVYLPFMPIWLAWRGMSPVEIGIIASAPMFVRILATPAIGLWSDAQGDHRRTIVLGGWCGLICAGLLLVSKDFWGILVLVIGFQIATQSILPLVETKCLAGARAYGLDYGRMRLWGSATFIAANVLGGFVVSIYGGGSVMIMVLVSVLLTAAAAHALPPDIRSKASSPEPSQSHSQTDRSGLNRMWALLLQPWFVLVVIAAGLIQGSHAVFYAFSALHWRDLGIPDHWIGLLWALGVVAEIVLFAVSARTLSHFGPIGLLALGGAAGVLRWTVMAFTPPFWMLFPLQCLHALSFGATHLGTINLIQSRVPPERAGTAQSLQAALGSGVIMGGATLVSGYIYEPLGASSFLIMSCYALAGTIAALLIVRVDKR